jgi:hypothetical protein
VTTHAEARNLAQLALVALFDRKPTDGEVKALAGVACLETSYGDGWKGAGRGSNNMGAIQGVGPAGAFVYTDTHPNKDGTNTPYEISFRRYRTALEGWVDLARVAFVNRGRERVRVAASESDWYGVSRALHETGYYEGYGRTEAERIANHHRALLRSITAADGATAPTVAVPAAPETVRVGSRGPAVVMLQQELGLAADGMFGPVTEMHLRRWQADHDLVPDGVCGPRTWAALLGDDLR